MPMIKGWGQLYPHARASWLRYSISHFLRNSLPQKVIMMLVIVNGRTSTGEMLAFTGGSHLCNLHRPEEPRVPLNSNTGHAKTRLMGPLFCHSWASHVVQVPKILMQMPPHTVYVYHWSQIHHEQHHCGKVMLHQCHKLGYQLAILQNYPKLSKITLLLPHAFQVRALSLPAFLMFS